MVSEKVKVTTDKGVSDLFDAVVLTMSVPQILQLQEDIQALIGRFIWDLVKDVSIETGEVKVTQIKVFQICLMLLFSQCQCLKYYSFKEIYSH